MGNLPVNLNIYNDSFVEALLIKESALCLVALKQPRKKNGLISIG